MTQTLYRIYWRNDNNVGPKQFSRAMLLKDAHAEIDRRQANNPTLLTWLEPHNRVVGGGGRQQCCTTCHECGSELLPVLDGELWCQNCETYR